MLDTEETLGEIALEQIRQFSVDHTILTVSGISETGQIMRYRIDEVMIARAMVRRAKKITILADHTKWRLMLHSVENGTRAANRVSVGTRGLRN